MTLSDNRPAGLRQSGRSADRKWRLKPLSLGRLGLVWVVAVAACTTPTATPAAAPTSAAPAEGPTAAATVNVVEAAGLRAAIALEILEYLTPGQPPVARAQVTEAEQLAGLIAALDVEVALQPRARCLERYRLRFTLSDGTQPEFGYVCADGGAWLRGAQAFWQFRDIAAPEAFRQLVDAQLQAAPTPAP